MKIETGKKFKKKDLEMNIQTMRCGGCHEWLKLILGSRNIIIDDISIQLQNFPLLECRNCSSIYLPDKSKGIILYFLVKLKKEIRSV